MRRRTIARAVVLAVAAIVVTVPPCDAQEARSRSLTPSVLHPGDTLVADDTLFVLTREAMERVRERQVRDSIRVANLRADVDNLEAQRDSFFSAWQGCQIAKAAWEEAADAHRSAQRAYEEQADDGLGAFLFNGPSGFAVGGLGGLTAGVLACRGAR